MHPNGQTPTRDDDDPGITVNYRDTARLLLRLPYLFQRMPDFDRLQIGCGSNVLPGWINTDMLPGRGIPRLDVNNPLPFPSGHFHYVFSEHLIEHIPFERGVKLLREIHRVLAPNGKVRIATPDFAFLVRLYQRPDMKYVEWAAQWSSIPATPLHTVNNFVRNWGHQFIWDYPTMEATLESVGFVNIVECAVGESNDPALRGIEWHGRVIGEKWNALETFVVEAQKPVVRSAAIAASEAR